MPTPNLSALEILTVEQAAKILLCTEQTINEKCNARELPALKFGRGWILPAKALNDYLCSMAMQRVENGKPISNVMVALKTGNRKRSGQPALPTLFM